MKLSAKLFVITGMLTLLSDASFANTKQSTDTISVNEKIIFNTMMLNAYIDDYTNYVMTAEPIDINPFFASPLISNNNLIPSDIQKEELKDNVYFIGDYLTLLFNQIQSDIAHKKTLNSQELKNLQKKFSLLVSLNKQIDRACLRSGNFMISTEGIDPKILNQIIHYDQFLDYINSSRREFCRTTYENINILDDKTNDFHAFKSKINQAKNNLKKYFDKYFNKSYIPPHHKL